MTNEMSRRKFLLGAGSAAAAATAGCLGGDDENPENEEESNEMYSAEEMEFMDRGAGIDQTWAGFAERSAEMSLESYNQDMQMSGNYAGNLPDRESVEEPIIDLDFVELHFSEVPSDTPAKRYKAHFHTATENDTVYEDFGNFDENEELLDERLAQAFGAVMHPTVGTLFNDGHGPDYRKSQREADQPAITGIEYTIQDQAGNQKAVEYDSQEVDELSQTYDEERNQVDTFTNEVLERL